MSSCESKPTSSRDVTAKSPVDIYADSSMRISSVKNDEYITFDTVKFLIPKNLNIDSSNIYNGIYEISRSSFIRRKFLVFNNLAYLTTFEDLGIVSRSHLYVFDIKKKSFVKDSTFKRDYLVSTAAIFMINSTSNRILIVGKPALYDAKQEVIVPASLYSIKGGYFDYLKNVYKVSDEVPTDTALVSFFNKSMATNSKDVLPLPNDWWKPNK